MYFPLASGGHHIVVKLVKTKALCYGETWRCHAKFVPGAKFVRGVWLQTSTHTLQTSTHTHFRCRQKHPPTRRKLRAGGCLERELHIIQQRPLGSHFSVGRRIRCNNGTHCTKM